MHAALYRAGICHNRGGCQSTGERLGGSSANSTHRTGRRIQRDIGILLGTVLGGVFSALPGVGDRLSCAAVVNPGFETGIGAGRHLNTGVLRHTAVAVHFRWR
ncbi:hypothetical protein GNX18_14675 [Microbulbifer sp. SH-1]|nr:hypothetical protein GNX18_14675 [Microbulbifer sp. SH-1]